MNDKTIADDILEQAADWYDQLEELTPQQRHDYQNWLTADPQHQLAMQWLQKHYGEHEADVVLAAAVLPAEDAAPRQAQTQAQTQAQAQAQAQAIRAPEAVKTAQPQSGKSSIWQQLNNWFSAVVSHPLSSHPMAAMALVIVLALPLFLTTQQHSQPSQQSAQAGLSTGLGEQQRQRLADGSDVYLNAGSQVMVDLQENQRLLQLTQGEAFFEVAPDKARPFYVDAGDVRIRVVGTAFNVDRSADVTAVEVDHGQVQVSAFGRSWNLRAGDGLRLLGESAERYQTDHVSDWRNDWREVQGEPLSVVVEHLQRYSRRPIRLQGIDNSLQFSGSYRQSDVEGTLHLIASLFDLSVQLGDDSIIVTGHAQGEH